MAMEEFCAHHAETVEDVMRWPWRRFERMFKLHLLRRAREELRQMRDMRLAALDANTNFDSKDNRRAKEERVEGLQQAYLSAVRMLYAEDKQDDQKGLADDAFDDPLFAPLKRRAAALQEQSSQPLVEQAGMGHKLLEAIPG
jgi:cation transport regulator ChaB